jgi:hypothetical protein
LRDAAIEYAIKLALATYDGRWVEYVFDLLISLSIPCPEPLMEGMHLAAITVTGFDRDLLERYLRSLRGQPPNLERIRALQRAETIKRAIVERRA